jgi:hypothetical protein
MTIMRKTEVAAPESERHAADLVDAGLSALRAGASEELVIEAFGRAAGRGAAIATRMGLLPSTPQEAPDVRFLDELEAKVVEAYAASPRHVRVARWRLSRRRALVAVAAVSLLAVAAFLSAYPGRGARPMATAAAQTGTATGATPMSRSTSHPVGRATAMPAHRLEHQGMARVAGITSSDRNRDAVAPVAAPSGSVRSATAAPPEPGVSRNRTRAGRGGWELASHVRQAACR